MKTTVTKVGKLAFEATTASGHRVVMDSSPDVGGENKGPRPMEMILMGLGSCSSIDVIVILEKARQDVKACRVEIESTRAPEVPKVFTDIHLHYVIEGNQIDPKKVERALKLTAEKYCSASIMLSHSVNITHDYKLIDA